MFTYDKAISNPDSVPIHSNMLSSSYVLASDPAVEPAVKDEEEKIEQLKEVVSRIQDRNC